MITQNTVFVTYMCGFCCFFRTQNKHTHPETTPPWGSAASRRSPLIAWRSRVQGVFIKLSRHPQENSNIPQEHTLNNPEPQEPLLFYTPGSNIPQGPTYLLLLWESFGMTLDLCSWVLLISFLRWRFAERS